MLTKLCAHCNNPYTIFKSRSGRSHYCSKECQFLAKKHSEVEKICPLCRTTFTVPFLLRSHKEYCSRRCAGIASVESYRVKIDPRPCAHCKKPYTPDTKHRASSKYCSRQCAGASKITRQSKKCPSCGRHFVPSRPSIQYCSMQCRIGKKMRTVEVFCLQCGNAFQTAQPKKAKLCSDSCANLYNKAHQDKFSLVIEYLSYNPMRGELRWKKSPGPKAPVGGIAGTRTTDGYLSFRLKRMHFKCSIVAWALYHNRWPSGLIDHKDGDTANNRIENLREVTNGQNVYNQLPRSTSGYKGVYVRPENGTYRASIHLDGKNKSLGTFTTAEAANAARIKAEKEYGVHEYAESGRARSVMHNGDSQ